LAQLNLHVVRAGRDFGLDSMLSAMGQDQQTASSPCMLERDLCGLLRKSFSIGF
jgi:hypothetical protein